MCGLNITMLQNPGLGMCGLYIAMLHFPGLGYMWFVHCNVAEPRAGVCVVCTLQCCRTQG